MALEKMRCTLTSRPDVALMMHSNRGVNPRDPDVKKLKEVLKKRVKSEEDLDQIARLEWELALYHDAEIGPYLPAEMILACVRDAGKRTKQGKQIIEAVLIEESRIPLKYDGPRDIEALYSDGRFFDLRPARVMGRTVNRARGYFPKWSVSFTLTFYSELIDGEDVQRILTEAGLRVGIGDYRPYHGRFTVSFK
jgi:hypothetical protein